MRLVKPLRLSVLQRCFEARGGAHLALGLLVYFAFDAPEVPLPEVSLWKGVPAELGKDAILDEGMPKPRGEVLVYGSVFSPGGVPRPGFQASLSVGPIDKRVVAVGPREWKLDGPTAPELVTSVRLGWPLAFGGEGFAPNPVGVGFAPVDEGAGKVHRLPQLEDPAHLVKRPGDRPTPTSLGAMDLTWPERARHRGTYDERWLAQDFPALARDLDPEFFMTAPVDQRLPGWLDPGTPVLLENLHAHKPRQQTHVPRLRGRAFATRDGSTDLDEISLRPETLILLPAIERGVLLLRGVVQVREWDAHDVTCLVLGLEAPDQPKPVAHYADVLARRTDKQRGAMAALRERDLLPPPVPSAPKAADETYSDMTALMATEGLLEKHARAKAERELEKLRLDLRMRGIDPDEKGVPKELEPPKPPPDLEELDDYVQELERVAKVETERAEDQRRSALDEARRVCAERGIDFDAEVEKRRKEQGGPPKFRARDEIEKLENLAEAGRKGGHPIESLEAKLADPTFREKLVAAEAAQIDAYRRFGHHFPSAYVEEARAAALRAEVEATLEAGGSLAGRDLTGADLRGIDLSGRDLTNAMLEAARLDGASLDRARLDGAVLARASLVEAKLDGASLREANLGSATIDRASLRGACLDGAVLMGASARGACFDDASLAKLDAMKASFAGASLARVVLDEVVLLEVDLEGARLQRASMKKALVVKCKAAGVDLADARCDGMAFVETAADGGVFDRASMRGVKFVAGSSLRGASLVGADLSTACLRGVDLHGARLERAICDATDFSEATLTEAVLTDVRARKALFMRTKLDRADLRRSDFIDALFMAASLAGTRADQANLFRASLLGAKGDDRTSFAGAHVARTLMPRRR